MLNLSDCWERGGQPEWDMNDYSRDFVWLGIDRSQYPTIQKGKYMITEMDLDNWFSYHAPTGTQETRYVAIRDKAKELATLIIHSTPVNADQTAAIRKLRECVMTANAAIACGE